MPILAYQANRGNSRSLLRKKNSLRRIHPYLNGIKAWFLADPMLFSGGIWRNLIQGSHNGSLIGLGNSGAFLGFGGTSRSGGSGELRFQGTTAYVSVRESPDIFILTSESIAISFWYFSYIPNGAVCDFIRKGTGNSTYLVRATGGTSTDQIAFFYRGSDISGISAASVSGLPKGQWIHIIGTYTLASGLFVYYVNGVQRLTQTGVCNTNIADTGEALTIGSNSGVNPFYGFIDDIRIYKNFIERPIAQGIYRDGLTGYKETFLRKDLHFFPIQSAGQSVTISASQMAWQATTLIHRSSLQFPPTQMAWQATTLPQTRSFTITSAQMAWMAATLLNGSAVTLSISPAKMAWAATTLLQRHGLVIPPTQMAWQAPTPILGRAFTLTPAQMAWQANALVLGRSMGITPAQIAWQATTPLLGRSFLVTPGQMAWQANTLIIPRVIVITATQMGWQAQTLTLTATDIGTTPYQRRAGVIVLPIEEHHTPVFLLLDERADPIFLGFL